LTARSGRQCSFLQRSRRCNMRPVKRPALFRYGLVLLGVAAAPVAERTDERHADESRIPLH
jgi:hypothetical protein